MWTGDWKDWTLIVSLLLNLLLGKIMRNINIYMTFTINLAIMLINTYCKLRKVRSIKYQNLEMMNQLAGSSQTIYKND